jgi:hypothetical protein
MPELYRARYHRQFRPEFSRLHHDRDLFWVAPLSVRYVIAVAGMRFAGRSSALNYLAEKRGFRVYSLTSALHEIARQRGIPMEPRFHLQNLGDEVRSEHHDHAYLARLVLRRIHQDHLGHRPGPEGRQRVAVGGFKRPEEVAVFERLDRFGLFDITSEESTRYRRALESGMLAAEIEHLKGPPKCSLDTFREHIDHRDLHGRDDRWTGAFGQQVNDVVGRPNAVPIANEDDLAKLYENLNRAVDRLDDDYRSSSG